MLLSTILRQRRLVAGGAALYMLWQVCESLVPVTIGVVIDRAIAPGEVSAIVGWLAGLAGLFLVLSLSFRFASRLSERAAGQAAHEVRVDVAAHLLDPRTESPQTGSTGSSVSLASSDADRVGELCSVVPSVFGSAVSVIFAAAVLLRISTVLGLVVLLGSLALLVVLHVLGGPLERRADDEQARAAEAAGVETDLLTGLRVRKGIGAEEAAGRRYQLASRRSLFATIRAARLESLYEAGTVLLTLLFLALIALVGGRLAVEGRISVGDLVSAVGLAQFLLGPLSQLSSAREVLARSRASADRIASVTGPSVETRPTVAMSPSTPYLATAPASRPGPRGEFRLTVGDLNLHASPEEMVGVAADSAGASTLVRTIASAWHDPADPVTVDGVPMRDYDPATVGQVLLVGDSRLQLFAESLLDNVSAHHAAPVKVERAIRAADVAQVADMLPSGSRTVLTERGRSLSGGQRQRILLARALAFDPDVLVLHDPCTAVDSVTESRIAGGIRAGRVGRTTILVTTSPALLAVCGRVMLLADGGIEDQGTHQELLRRSSRYRDLVLW